MSSIKYDFWFAVFIYSLGAIAIAGLVLLMRDASLTRKAEDLRILIEQETSFRICIEHHEPVLCRGAAMVSSQ